MSRPPFTAPPPSTPPAQVARPTMPGTEEQRTMIIGRGISVHGSIQDAERLVVEGVIEAQMIHATELAITQGGMFRGEIQVDHAEIAGTIDGTLTCRATLIVSSTGRVLGKIRCYRLQVEDGGHITGQIEMITDPRSASPVVAAALSTGSED